MSCFLRAFLTQHAHIHTNEHTHNLFSVEKEHSWQHTLQQYRENNQNCLQILASEVATYTTEQQTSRLTLGGGLKTEPPVAGRAEEEEEGEG